MLVMVVCFIAFRWIHLSTPLIRLFLLVLILLLMPTLNFLPVWFALALLRFFFSSRRRHTSSYGDWSSDVCSSDLAIVIYLTGWTPIDPILSVLVAALILRSAWKLLAKSIHILLEGAPEDASPEKVEQEIGRASCRERV